jgi:CRISPR-associated protein Cmr2
MAYLFSLALGPAQQFIAAARRTRDLWFSSWLLSELSKAAARGIGKDRLIFPSVADDRELEPGSEFNVSNKILAKVDDDPRRLGESVKAAVHNRLNEIRDRAFDEALKDLPAGSCNLDKAKAQVDDLLEIYWAAVPLNGDYAQARRRVEALLAARKNTRNFGPTDSWRGNEWKSALDGLRESVIRRADTIGRRGMKKNETLCGVGLLKRFGNSGNQREGEGFASVPHIAAWPLIQSFNEGRKKALDEYVGFLREKGINRTALYCPPSPRSDIFPYDGHILFEEQLKEYFDETAQRTELEQAREKLRKLLTIEIGANPSPYYAILHGDGDRMGEAIDAQRTVEEHQKLSKALSKFAADAREIVKEHNGSMIYAGGDDVLALVPLNTVIQCSRRLANIFKEKLNEFKNANEKSPTLSIGIGISHQMDPLEEALKLAREAEMEAKQFDNRAKDALCIKVSKRSGTVTTVVDRWGALDERLKLFTTFHQDDELPDGAAYELRRLADDFRDFPREHKAGAYKKEAARILSRKRSKRSAEAIRNDVQQKLLARVPDDPEETSKAFSALADELIVARLFVNKFERKGETK